MAIEKKQDNSFQKLSEGQIPPGRIRKKVLTSTKFSQTVFHIVDLYLNKTVAMIGVLVNKNHVKK